MRRFFDVASTQGVIGTKAAVFNGSSSSFQTPLTTGFNLQELSFSIWTKISSVNSTNIDIIGNYSSANKGWILRLTSSNKFSFLTSLASIYVTAATTPIEDIWYNVTVTNSVINGESKIYINGSLESTISYAPGTQIPYTAAGMNLAFGAGLSDTLNARFLNGSLDQIRIFNKALSQSEVTTLFQEGESAPLISTTDIFGDGSGVALYRFEDNANDESGNYNGVATDITYQ